MPPKTRVSDGISAQLLWLGMPADARIVSKHHKDDMWRCSWSVCFAVPVNEGDHVQLEYYLNCVRYAGGKYLQIHDCFLEAASRQIVADFLSACQSAATCNLWTRVTTLCNALYIALQSINLTAGGRPSSMFNHDM